MLAVSLTAMTLGAFLLFFSITRLLNHVRGSVVARLPVTAEQTLRFDHAGTFILNVEGPRFSKLLPNAQYVLREGSSGKEVRSWPIVFRTTTSGFSRVRLSIRGFEIPQAGSYVIAITGIDPAADAAQSAIVFTRPYGAALVVLILGIVLGAASLIGGVVFTALQFAGK